MDIPEISISVPSSNIRFFLQNCFFFTKRQNNCQKCFHSVYRMFKIHHDSFKTVTTILEVAWSGDFFTHLHNEQLGQLSNQLFFTHDKFLNTTTKKNNCEWIFNFSSSQRERKISNWRVYSIELLRSVSQIGHEFFMKFNQLVLTKIKWFELNVTVLKRYSHLWCFLIANSLHGTMESIFVW